MEESEKQIGNFDAPPSNPYYFVDTVPSVRERKPYPSFGAATGLLGILLGASIIGGIIIGILVTINPDIVAPGFMVAYLISFLITLWLGIIFRRSSRFSGRGGPWYLWPLLILFTFLFLILREPLLHLVPIPMDEDKDLISGLQSLNPFLVVVTVAAAPIFEELIFRGIILDGFLKRYKPWTAIILSAIIFGVAHLNPLQFINAFILGLIMGWIYWKTGSLLLTILIHFINNLSATIPAYFWNQDRSMVVQASGGTMNFIWVYAVSLVLALLIWWLVVFLLKNLDQKRKRADTGGFDDGHMSEGLAT